MLRDTQLQGVSLKSVLEKRRLDQALNAKEFAVLAGISYSSSREWFRLPGFPVLRGKVFWGDFVEWRHARFGLNQHAPAPAPQPQTNLASGKAFGLPAKAARILAEIG